jgi:hypothetical protein
MFVLDMTGRCLVTRSIWSTSSGYESTGISSCKSRYQKYQCKHESEMPIRDVEAACSGGSTDVVGKRRAAREVDVPENLS